MDAKVQKALKEDWTGIFMRNLPLSIQMDISRREGQWLTRASRGATAEIEIHKAVWVKKYEYK
jgi:hypothetical protein